MATKALCARGEPTSSRPPHSTVLAHLEGGKAIGEGLYLSQARSTRGRGEVLGQAGVAEACAYTLEGVSKNQKKVR